MGTLSEDDYAAFLDRFSPYVGVQEETVDDDGPDIVDDAREGGQEEDEIQEIDEEDAAAEVLEMESDAEGAEEDEIVNLD